MLKRLIRFFNANIYHTNSKQVSSQLLKVDEFSTA